MQEVIKEWTTNDIGDFATIAEQENVSWLVRTIEENGKTYTCVILSKLGFKRLRLKSSKLTLKQLLDKAVERITSVFSEKKSTRMLTLDEIKEKITKIDDIRNILKELHNCPDPFTKPLCRVIYNDGNSNPERYLPERILKKVISVGIQHYKQELLNDLNTLMGEIQCTSTISVDSQFPSNQTTTKNDGM